MSLYKNLNFLFVNVKREFHIRYLSSSLGWLWAIIQPLSLMLIYTLVFSKIMGAKLGGVDDPYAYSVYLCSGLCIWALFSEIILRMQNVFLDNSTQLKKVKLSKILMPATIILTALVNHCFLFGVFLIFTMFLGYWPGFALISVVPIWAVVIVFSTSLGLILGVLNVFYRDVGQFFSTFIQFWFWATPIVYPLSIIPENLHKFFNFNPLYGVINQFQTIFLTGNFSEISKLSYSMAVSILLAIVGYAVYTALASDVLDEL